MKRLAYPAVAAIALCVCGAAWPKGLSPDRICGETMCVDLDGRPESAIVLDANAASPPPAPSGYYRVHYATAGAGPHLFVPRGNRLAAETARGRALRWYAPYGPGPERLRAAIRELRPIAAPPAWPTSIEVPAVSSREQNGSSLQPWVFGVALVLLAAGAILVRRAQVSLRTG